MRIRAKSLAKPLNEHRAVAGHGKFPERIVVADSKRMVGRDRVATVETGKIDRSKVRIEIIAGVAVSKSRKSDFLTFLWWKLV